MTTLKAKKDMEKVLTNILYFMKFAIKSFVIQLTPKMLSATYGRTYRRTHGHSELQKQLGCLKTS